MTELPVKVLLVDDDEDDFVITRDLIAEIGHHRYQLDWINNYPAALAAIQRREHDLCLLDYRLGEKTGLDLLRETQTLNLRPPMVLLTGQGDDRIDLEAMKAGAADYLVKGRLTANELDRAIRYAIEHKRSEERLRRERDLITRIMETSPVGIVVTDQAGRINFANHRAEEILGLSRPVLEQRACSVLDWRVADADGLPQDGQPLPLQQLLATGAPVVDVCHALQRNGRQLVLSANATPLRDAAGNVDGMVVIIEDITGRLALEAQLRQSQKMELVGQLAAGVAHDINNILTIIQGHAGLLLQTATAGSHTMKSLKQIAAASDRAASFVRHLLMFSRKQMVQTKLLDLNGVLRNLHSMLPQMLGEQIAIELCCPASLPPILADASMIEQIVMNLAVNARDAMPHGGTLHLETFAVEVPPALAREHPDARPGNFVCLCVRDTGCGMDRRVMQRIFEPFFTTKAIGKGTGLGLSTVYGIVRQHQGWVDVESEIGAGSTFKVFLPVAGAGNEGEGAPGAVRPAIADGTETVLIVEDDINVLKVLGRILQHYHYRVLTAVSALEALHAWEENQGQIDLLLTDLVMPGPMSGSDLIAELKKRKPELKVIMSSGYSADLLGRDVDHDGVDLLPKPYQPHMVAELVRKLLDAPAGNGSASSPPVPLGTTTVIGHPAGASLLQQSRTVSTTAT